MTHSGPCEKHGAACSNAVADCCSALAAQGVHVPLIVVRMAPTNRMSSASISVSLISPHLEGKKRGKKRPTKKKSLVFFWMDVYICLNITSVSLTRTNLQETKEKTKGHVECFFFFDAQP